MVKKATAIVEDQLVEDQPVGGAEGGVAVDVDAIAQSVLSMIGQVAKGMAQEEELPPLPADGIVVTLKPNLTFNGVIWPPGSIIDLELVQTDLEHRLEDDGHGNPFLNAVRRGEEQVGELAIWMEKTDENLADAEQRSYQAYAEWVDSLNRQKDYEELDKVLQAMGGPAFAPGQQPQPGQVHIEVNEIPERVITVGARLTGGDD
jgi:hypothetical protein